MRKKASRTAAESETLSRALESVMAIPGRNRGFRPKPSLTPAIAAELYKALERLEAPPDLLSVVGSYGDTLTDEEVLQYLKDWNETGRVMQERQ